MDKFLPKNINNVQLIPFKDINEYNTYFIHDKKKFKKEIKFNKNNCLICCDYINKRKNIFIRIYENIIKFFRRII